MLQSMVRGTPVHPVVKRAVVRATRPEVWRLWTTSEGMSSWLTEAHIELRVGGPFELYFAGDHPPGSRGPAGPPVARPVWDETRAYFDAAWGRVMDALVAACGPS